MSEPIIEYREEINVTDIARKYAERVARVIDEQTLANVENQLAGFGYVKVVRCRDCRWAKPDQSDHEYREYYHCDMWIADVGANGFCFRGLRKRSGRMSGNFVEQVCHHDDSNESSLLIVSKMSNIGYGVQCTCRVCGKHTVWCDNKDEAMKKGMKL